MGIDAIALLKGVHFTFPTHLRVERLEGAVLVHTGLRFGGALDEMAFALRAALGDALDVHDDPRGVFVLPDMAEPRATTYEGVIAEVAEAGEWVPRAAADQVPSRFADAPEDSFAGIMGQMMGALGGDTIAAMANALASGDPEALARAQEAMTQALGGQDRVEELAKKLMGAANAEGAGDPLGAGGSPLDPGAMDLDNPDLEAMAKQIEETMKKKPGGGA
jgi:hypothetical protein